MGCLFYILFLRIDYCSSKLLFLFKTTDNKDLISFGIKDNAILNHFDEHVATC